MVPWGFGIALKSIKIDINGALEVWGRSVCAFGAPGRSQADFQTKASSQKSLENVAPKVDSGSQLGRPGAPVCRSN